MSARELDLRPASAADDAERDRFVRDHPRGTFFHLAGWRRVVERVMRHRGRDLLAFEDGRLAGVLPLVRCRSLLGPPALISVPYGVYGGPLGRRPEVEAALFRSAEDAARGLCTGSPLRAEIEARGDLDAAVAAVARVLAERFGDGAISANGQALVVTARA